MSKVWAFIKRRKVLLIVIAIIGAIIGLFSYNRSKIKNQLIIVDTATVERENLVNSINLDGLVESEDSKKIYTELALPVLENRVEVGDKVKAGDILGVLDVRKLEENIEQQKAVAGSQEAANSNSITLAQKGLEYAKGQTAGGTSAALLQAEQAVIMAEEQLNMAEVGLDTAVAALQEYRKVRRESGIDTDEGDVQLQVYENGRDNSYAAYESAKTTLANARTAYEAAKQLNVQQIENYTDSIQTSRIASSATQSQWIAIDHLEGDLERAEIPAPIDGVVTAVYAQEGAAATGLLYIVEDIDNVKITAALKEYDLAYVKEGLNAVVKSDATGENEYTGKLENIAPTTIKTPTGDNLAGGTAEFETKITIDGASELRVGTKARVDIIYSEEENVLTVPYEALGQNSEKKDIVYVLEQSADDEKTYIVKQVPVEVGVQGDFKIEIKSSEIKEDAVIIKNAEGIVFDEKKGLSVHIKADIEALAKDGHFQAYMLTMEV